MSSAVSTFHVWTPDFGEVELKSSPSHDERSVRFLQEIVEQSLWEQLRRFPPKVVQRLLPKLTVPSYRRRLLEIWIEEATPTAR